MNDCVLINTRKCSIFLFFCFLEWLHYERMSEKSFKKRFSCKTVPGKDWKYRVWLRNVYTQHSKIIHARYELVLDLKHHPTENVKETVHLLCSKTRAHLCCWSVCRPVESHVSSCQIHSMPSFRARAALIATQG